jgi:heme o synthase
MNRYRSGSLFYIILELSKVRITVAVAFSTITGYILAERDYNPGFILPTLGIFFLACGSSVINHLQERRTDAMMKRTRQRPLPAHKISFTAALWIALAETFTGSLILYFSAGLVALILGLIAMFWYNGFYTYLKRITPNAVIPGSVIGSIPPLVGWVSAGGNLLSFQAGILALFFFIWQVPHFYLLALKYGHEYEEAGLPSIASRWSFGKAKSHIFGWIILTALAAVVVAFTHLSSSLISSFLIEGCSILLVFSFRNIRSIKEEKFNAFSYFMKINYFVLAVTLILVAGPFLYSTFHI